MKKGRKTITPAVAVCAHALSGDANRIQILPAGSFRGVDGRPVGIPSWNLTREDAGRIMADLNARKTSLVIDYEHQTLRSAENGLPAPAAGWTPGSGFEWVEGEGLFAKATWTAAARKAIDDGEYKYFSPVFLYHPTTGHALRYLHGALTNNPAVDGMAEIGELAAAAFNSSFKIYEDTPLDEQMLKLLGLTENSTDAEIAAAVAQHQNLVDSIPAIRAAANIDAGVAVDQVSGLIGSALAAAAQVHGTPDPAKYVPVETVTGLQAEMAALSQRVNKSELDSLIESALSQGKLSAAMEPWARGLGATNLAALTQFVNDAPSNPALAGENQTGGKTPKGAGASAAQDGGVLAAVTAQFGNKTEEVNKTAEQLAA